MSPAQGPVLRPTQTLTDAQLLAIWEPQAQAGIPSALARVAFLRTRIERDTEQRA